MQSWDDCFFGWLVPQRCPQRLIFCLGFGPFMLVKDFLETIQRLQLLYTLPFPGKSC